MSESDEEKFSSNFVRYKSDIESLRRTKRPMLLWSVVSLVYVCGELQLKSSKVAPWGVQITGITEEKFAYFLLLVTSYYAVKWCWSNFLKLRFDWRKGTLSELWKCLKGPRIAEIREQLDMETAYNYKNGSEQVTDKDKDFSSTVFSDRFVIALELFGIPYILPLSVFVLAFLALLCRLVV